MCGLPLFPKPKHENPTRARPTLRRIATKENDRVGGRSEAGLAVGSTLPAISASSHSAPPERAALLLKVPGEP